MTGRVAILARLCFGVAGGGRADRLARVLAAEGFEVVLAALGSEGAPEREEREYLLLRPPRDPPPSGPLRHLGADPSLGRAAAEHRPDLVIATDPTTLVQAVQVATETGARVLYDTWEIYPDQIEQTVPRRWFRPVLTRLLRRQVVRAERRALPLVAGVLFTSEGHRDLFHEWHGDAVPGVAGIVRNCPFAWRAEPNGHLRREAEVAPGERLLVYAGSLGPSRGLLPMVEAMRALPDCRLVVLGWGWLEGEMRAAAPENVVFLPPVPEIDLVATLSGADAGLLPIEAKNRSKEHSQANKLFEYLMAGLPIVATDLPGHRIVLAGTGAAVFVPEATSGAIALGVRELFMRDDESPGAFSRAARKAAERYSLERETPELLRVVEACLRGT